MLAARLSEDPAVQVLLVEAGLPDSDPMIHASWAWPMLLTPTSRGKVWLRTGMPGMAPRIQHNHFGTEEDRQTMLSGLRLVLEITAQPAIRAHQRGEPVNVPASDRDADLMAWLEREVIFMQSLEFRGGMDRGRQGTP